jgi:high-affinity Fe2+/Pb2+ permease
MLLFGHQDKQMTTLILLAIVVGLVTYGYYKIKEWWKKK